MLLFGACSIVAVVSIAAEIVAISIAIVGIAVVVVIMIFPFLFTHCCSRISTSGSGSICSCPSVGASTTAVRCRIGNCVFLFHLVDQHFIDAICKMAYFEISVQVGIVLIILADIVTIIIDGGGCGCGRYDAVVIRGGRTHDCGDLFVSF